MNSGNVTCSDWNARPIKRPRRCCQYRRHL
jgi:hypothetical protein